MDQPLQVRLQQLDGSEVDFFIEPSMAISQLKADVEDMIHADELHEVRLLHNGQELDYTLKVSQTCLEPGSIVQALLSKSMVKALEIVKLPTPEIRFKVPPALPPYAQKAPLPPRPPTLTPFRIGAAPELHHFATSHLPSFTADIMHIRSFALLSETYDDLITSLPKDRVRKVESILSMDGIREVIGPIYRLNSSLDLSSSSQYDPDILQIIEHLHRVYNKIDWEPCTEHDKVMLEIFMRDLVCSYRGPAVRAAALAIIIRWRGPTVPGLAQVAEEDPAETVRKVAAAALRSNVLPALSVGAKSPPLSIPPFAESAAADPEMLVPARAKAMAAGAPYLPTRPLVAQATCSQASTPLAQHAQVAVLGRADAEEAASATVVFGTSAAAYEDKQNADLAQAILLSKAEIPEMLSDDGVVLLRLDRHARASEVTTALLTSASLEACRASVSEADCELQPSWAGGAWILFPMTQQIYIEAGLDGLTSVFHILALSKDEAALQQALKGVPKPKRPLLRKVRLGSATIEGPQLGDAAAPPMNHSDVTSPANTASPAVSPFSESSDEECLCELVVERTFFTMRPIADDGSASLRSAPAHLQPNAA